jgi:hypothetical protein
MEIKQLNCSACGAPIHVPDDVEFLNCSSCGSYLSVQRGEGYIALKMVKAVADTIKQTGAETQSAIRDGAYATKTELQKLELTQEISTVEMQLSSLQGEIRGLERTFLPGKANTNANYRVADQLKGLHFQEYSIFERLYNLHRKLAVINSVDPDNDPVEIESQLLLAYSAIQALEKSDQWRGEVKDALKVQRNLVEKLKQNILQIKIKALRNKLPSSTLTIESATDVSTALDNYNLILKDIQQLEQMPKTTETIIVLKDFRKKRDDVQNQWRQFETQRVQTAAVSVNLPDPQGLDASQLQVNLTQIQNDITTLGGWQENDIIRNFLNNLHKKERNYQKALQQDERERNYQKALLQGEGNPSRGCSKVISDILTAFVNWKFGLVILVGGIILCCFGCVVFAYIEGSSPSFQATETALYSQKTAAVRPTIKPILPSQTNSLLPTITHGPTNTPTLLSFGPSKIPAIILSGQDIFRIDAVNAARDDGYTITSNVCELISPLKYLPFNTIFGGQLVFHSFRLKGNKLTSEVVVLFASNHTAANGPGLVIPINTGAINLNQGFTSGLKVVSPITMDTPGAKEAVECGQQVESVNY